MPTSTATASKIDFDDFPVEIVNSDQKGRCAFASRDIKAGELVLRARPYVLIPDSESKHRICYSCMTIRSDASLITMCPCCDYVGYCSKACQDDDLDRHRHECSLFKLADEKLGQLSSYAKDYTRLLIRALERRQREKQGLPVPNDGLLFEHVSNLCSNMESFSAERLSEFHQVAGILRGVFENQHGSVVHGDLDRFLLELICKEECNSFGLYTFKRVGEPRSSYGLALYPMAVYFNHSCAPNIVHTTDGHDQLFFANRDIVAGEEMMISYISLRQTAADRISELEDVFHFTCQCERCASDDDLLMEEERLKHHLCSNAECQGVYLPYNAKRKLATAQNDVVHSWKCDSCKVERLL